jgi:CHASE2 domain-containing sensor protein
MPKTMDYRDLIGEGKAMGTMSLLASTSVIGISIGAVVYVLLLITLGIISLRKGHWVMFIIGLFFPLFWFIGALLPRKVR